MTFPLIVQAGAGEPRVFEARFTIGKGGDLAVSDAYTSTYHAVCYPDADGDWLVEDLGSMNGTWLNGRRLSGPYLVCRGDKIRIGQTTLTLVPA